MGSHNEAYSVQLVLRWDWAWQKKIWKPNKFLAKQSPYMKVLLAELIKVWCLRIEFLLLKLINFHIHTNFYIKIDKTVVQLSAEVICFMAVLAPRRRTLHSLAHSPQCKHLQLTMSRNGWHEQTFFGTHVCKIPFDDIQQPLKSHTSWFFKVAPNWGRAPMSAGMQTQEKSWSFFWTDIFHAWNTTIGQWQQRGQ